MDTIAKDVVDSLKPLLGPLTPLLVFRVIKSMGYDSVSEMDDSSKKVLLEKLLTELIYPVVSTQKRGVMRAMLFSKLKFSNKSIEGENKKELIDYYASD